MLIYHGSSVPVKKPDLSKTSKYTKDFGDGFYCTALKQQAYRWALRKGNGRGIITTFDFADITTKSLKVLQFTETNKTWLDFVADNRCGVKHGYDIVIGPMADDTIYNYVQMYIDGSISADDFMVLAKFRYPTHQIAFCTEKALKYLEYIGYEEVI